MSYLIEIRACEPAQKWADNQASYKEAWEKCERGDWMLWIAKRQGVDLRTLTKAKVECAKLVEHLMTDGRSLVALRVAESYAEGNATLQEMDAAVSDAYAAAVETANAAYASANAADSAADSAVVEAVGTTAIYDGAATSGKETLRKCADICRQYIKFDDLGIRSNSNDRHNKARELSVAR